MPCHAMRATNLRRSGHAALDSASQRTTARVLTRAQVLLGTSRRVVLSLPVVSWSSRYQPTVVHPNIIRSASS